MEMDKAIILHWKFPELPVILELHKQVFKSFGYDTQIFHPPLTSEDYEKINRGAFIWTLMNHMFLDDTISRHLKIPVITAIDGYGQSSMLPDTGPIPDFCQVTKYADLVTCLDLNAYEEFANSNQPFQLDKIFFVPNGKNPIPLKTKISKEFVVGCLLKEVPRTREQHYYLEATNIVAKKHPEITFVFPVFWWKTFNEAASQKKYPSVRFQPLVPYAALPQYLADCDIFTHYSSYDAFSKAITEAALAKKAPIVSDQVKTQGIARKHLPSVKEAIGQPIDKAYVSLKSVLGSGHMQHLIIVPKRNPQACAEAILRVYTHLKRYQEMGEEAKLWADEWYTWREKWELTFKLLEERGLM